MLRTGAAAQELNLSQSAVSHRVRQLERHLGVPLFERLPRGLRLTESGKTYLPSVRKAFEELFASTTGIFGPAGEGRLIVRAPVSYSALWIAPALDSFLTAYPGIDVRLCSSIWADSLAGDDTDIDLRIGFGNWAGHETELALRETVLPACNDAAGSSKTPISRVADLAARELIHVMGLEDLWIKLSLSAGLPLDSRRRDVKVDSTVAALELAPQLKRIAGMADGPAGHLGRDRELWRNRKKSLLSDRARTFLLGFT